MSGADVWAEEWLEREDSVGREGRLSRLIWVISEYPAVEFQLFTGGVMSKYVFEEARYCFVYGQFLATVMLGLAFLEQALAGAFYAGSRADLESAGLSTLVAEALRSDWISKAEYERLERARKNRNRVAHFRRPGGAHTIERRAVERDEVPYSVIEEDAKNVLALVFALVKSWPYAV
jgi:hypothetical protein